MLNYFQKWVGTRIRVTKMFTLRFFFKNSIPNPYEVTFKNYNASKTVTSIFESKPLIFATRKTSGAEFPPSKNLFCITNDTLLSCISRTLTKLAEVIVRPRLFPARFRLGLDPKSLITQKYTMNRKLWQNKIKKIYISERKRSFPLKSSP